MPVGGTPARPRWVITLSVGGGVVLSAVLGVHTCCQPIIPPDPPPQPDPVVDAAELDVAEPEPQLDAGGDLEDRALPKCEFVGPRARGAKRRETRIVGGKPSQAGAFPFAAALTTSSGVQYCGASIIGRRFALTAAHCQVEAGDRVLVGANALADMRQLVVVASRIHAGFDHDTLDYDVAVAVLGADAGVPTVPLARGVTALDATVIGWGKTCESCPTTQHLREVSVPLWEPGDCIAATGSTVRQVCAGLAAGGKDSCQGDSGGSLLTWNVDHWEQIGVVSWGIGCARPNSPGVYSDMRAPELRQWVASCAR